MNQVIDYLGWFTLIITVIVYVFRWWIQKNKQMINIEEEENEESGGTENECVQEIVKDNEDDQLTAWVRFIALISCLIVMAWGICLLPKKIYLFAIIVIFLIILISLLGDSFHQFYEEIHSKESSLFKENTVGTAYDMALIFIVFFLPHKQLIGILGIIERHTDGLIRDFSTICCWCFYITLLLFVAGTMIHVVLRAILKEIGGLFKRDPEELFDSFVEHIVRFLNDDVKLKLPGRNKPTVLKLLRFIIHDYLCSLLRFCLFFGCIIIVIPVLMLYKLVYMTMNALILLFEPRHKKMLFLRLGLSFVGSLVLLTILNRIELFQFKTKNGTEIFEFLTGTITIPFIFAFVEEIKEKLDYSGE